MTCVIAIYVGVRTLLTWHRTRMIQELCIGSNLTAIALGGLILTAISTAAKTTGQPYPLVLYAIGLLAFVVHVAAVYAGTWSIFRPNEQWPVLAVAAATALAAFWMVLALSGDSGRSEFRATLMLSIRGTGMAWAAAECFYCSAQLRRRAAIGLADPLVAHRIWLWGVGATAALVSISLELGSWVVYDHPLQSRPIGMHLMSLLGLIGTLAVYLAFFPPDAYARWIAGRLNRQQAGRGLPQR